MDSLKAIHLKPFQGPEYIDIHDLTDIHDALEGYMETIYLELQNGPRCTLLVNDSFLLGQFDVTKDSNHLATALAISGRRPDVRVLGPALVTGPVSGEDLTNVPESIYHFLSKMFKGWQELLQEEK
jgi:hypothetical protein